ncbi:MAG: SUF system NifU family Fe-S cluster assembly protein [Gemmatimonadetes bacterium]|nr:SUF system NifU family Fe-S cluster assembly protein [Gemmatimonadota bacterium]
MSDLDELYQTLILEHNKSPRNFRALAGASGHAAGRNPLCGDTFDVWVKVRDGLVEEVSFLGQGCAISKASASMMTTAVKGKTVADADALFRRFHQVVTGHATDSADLSDPKLTLGCLSAFAGVSAFPIRVKCATLAWHALMTAIHSPDAGVNSTTP